MRPKTVLLIIALAALVVSCIPSLYPLYKPGDLLLNDKLEGIFRSDDEDYWEIEKLDLAWEQKFGDGWNAYQSGYTYKLTVREEELVQDFAMHLLQLGGDYYLDFYPVNFDVPHKFLREQLIPAHIFAKAEISDKYLVLHFFNNDWLKGLFEESQIRISHVELPSRWLLTAKTDELQKFIVKYANDSTAFIEADTLLKKPV